MKRFKYLGCFVILMFSFINVNAKEIGENIEPIKKNEKFVGMNVFITIPEDYNNDIVTIKPSIFKCIADNRVSMPGDNYLINLDVNNLSNYDYEYVNDSFVLSTSSLNRNNNTEKAFDGFGIDEIYYPNRTYNAALKSLLGKNVEPSDSNIDNDLKLLGYNGIDDLMKYYQDYYNKEITDGDYAILQKVFSGNPSNYKESNNKLAVYAFNYFYKHLLGFGFKDDELTDINLENYSIFKYMNDNSYGDSEFNKAFNYLNTKSSNSLNDMHLKINFKDTSNAFAGYNFDGEFNFKLKKVKASSHTEPTFTESDDELINPPNTGI